jgi:hypothetical protein
MSTLANIARPASWSAKMVLTGEPLITDAQFEQLLINGEHWEDAVEYSDDTGPVPVVKIFLPHMRWLIGRIYPTSLDRCFVLAKFAQGEPEFGDVLLSDIVGSTSPFGVTPERDKYIKLDKPMSWYADHPRAW